MVEGLDTMIDNDSILLIIDMQNDYCSCEGFYAKRDGSSFTMNIVADKLIDFYNKVIVNNVKTVCFSMLYEDGDNPCLKGTWGAEYYGISPQIMFYKTEFSCFSNEAFCQYLKVNEIKKIYVCGFQTIFCVNETLKDAVERGFEVYLIENLIGEREKHKKKILDVLTYAKSHANIIMDCSI